MVKRNAVCTLIAALVALLFPWLAVTLVRGDGGMAVCFLLFFAVNPVTAILLGIFFRQKYPRGMVPAAAVRRAVPAGNMGVLYYG